MLTCSIKPLLTYLFLLGSLAVFSQSPEIDSLKKVVAAATEDTNKIKKSNALIWQLKNAGEYGEALKYVETTRQLAEKLHFVRGLADVYLNEGLVYNYVGNYPRALECQLTSLRYAEEINSDSRRANALSNIGNLYNNQGNYSKALEYQEKARKIRERILSGSHDRRDILSYANSLGNIGIIYNSMAQRDTARAYHVRSLKLMREAGDPIGEANELNNIASCLLDDDSLDAALHYYEQALALYREIGYKSGEGTALDNISDIYLRQGNLARAKDFALRALKIVTEIEDLDGIRETNFCLFRIYEAMGEYTLALKHYKEQIRARDSLLNEENTRNTVRLEMNYEFEKKEAAARIEQEKKEVLAQAEAHKQKIILLAVSGLGLLILAFGIFAYRSYLQKQKANIEITRQKELIEAKQKEIVDSIHYARRIQTALLPHEKYVSRKLRELKKNIS